MGADALWSQGIDGHGQTVAVLDMGFGGLDDSIAAGELPRQRIERVSFDSTYGFEGRNPVGVKTQHGTRMAEIINDVAPGANLLLVNYHTHEEFQRAVDWAITRRPAVVSHSNSFLLPPFDGTGPNAAAVNRAAAAGILWVNSAGNFAQRHWTGQTSTGETVIPLEVQSGTALSYSVAPFGKPTDRIRAELQQRNGSTSWVTRETVIATGSGILTETLVSDGGEWRMVLRQTSGDGTRVRVFSRTVGFGDFAAVEGSIPTPGDAAGSFTVGAVPWTTSSLAPYSSRGPTQDGRSKPDVVGPTYVTANAAWPGTAGTSASTAHVAGAAALVLHERRRTNVPIDLATLRETLTTGALDLGDPGYDPSYGNGIVRLDTAPPQVKMAVTDHRLPWVTGWVLDQGTIGDVVVSVDGVPVRKVRSAQLRVRLPRLAPGRHRVVVSASDTSGNRTTAGQWVTVGR